MNSAELNRLAGENYESRLREVVPRGCVSESPPSRHPQRVTIPLQYYQNFGQSSQPREKEDAQTGPNSNIDYCLTRAVDLPACCSPGPADPKHRLGELPGSDQKSSGGGWTFNNTALLEKGRRTEVAQFLSHYEFMDIPTPKLEHANADCKSEVMVRVRKPPTFASRYTPRAS